MNDIRAEFEKAMRNELYPTLFDMVGKLALKLDLDGETYLYGETQAAWESFKAGAALNAVSVPDGYVLVTIEPTKEMLEAWHRAYEKGQWNADSWESAFSLAHKAMINAAPKAKGEPS